MGFMLNSQDENSFRENVSNNIEEVGLFEAQLMKESRSRLKLLFSQDLLSHKPDPKHSRELCWFLFHPFSIEDLNHIFYFFTCLGFRLISEKGSLCYFRYIFPKDISLHTEVQKVPNGFVIRAHIDIGIHKEITYNTLTLSVLSELAYYLQKVDSKSQTITHTTGRLLELEKSKSEEASINVELDKPLEARLSRIERDNKQQL